jgi:hypothetical protein
MVMTQQTTANHPDKQLVRNTMGQQRLARLTENKVLAPEEIRRQLGRGLVGTPSVRSR